MALDCIPAYARASFRFADMHAPGAEDSPRPVAAGAPAPESCQPSNLARVAFRDACRDCDARGVEPIRAGASR
jgi:hypothetical protein